MRCGEAVLYDGWTANSIQYMGLLAVFCADKPYTDKGAVKYKRVVRTAVLSISTMTKSGTEDANEEAECFHADVHIHHFRDISVARETYRVRVSTVLTH